MKRKPVEGLQERFNNDDYYDIFGIALEDSDSAAQKPLFSSELLDFWSPLGTLGHSTGDYEIGLCRIKAPFSEFDRMERHLDSEEIIIPLSGDLFIPIAPIGDEISPRDIRIVPVRMGEIIRLRAGVWHFACGTFGCVPLDYFVILKTDTPKDDLEMRELGSRMAIDR
jgi:hypothetical protein